MGNDKVSIENIETPQIVWELMGDVCRCKPSASPLLPGFEVYDCDFVCLEVLCLLE